MADLTPRQQQVLTTIRTFLQEHGYPPTLREIGRQLGISGTLGVMKHLEALERKGYLRKDPGSSRGIVITNGTPAMVNLPIIGTVRAGMPQPAQEEIEGYLALDPTLAPQEDAFLLRVKGDSMIEAGILEGDLALVRPQATAENGDIVIALIDGEATMKQFLRLPGAIQLKPANRHFSPIIIPADGPELAIIGKVTTIIRQLA